MSESLVELQNVTVMRDGRGILGPLSLEIRHGERWVILGPNGSGKSTVLSMMATRTWPTSGSVRILGEELGRVDVRTLRSRIAMVSASLARAFRPDIDVIDVIVTGKDGALERWWGTYPTQTVERANQLLESTGLRNRSHSPFAVLSEGERQRVLIARALMGEPELLLLDEPAAGLDLGAREDLISLMEQVVQTSAISGFVLVTHHVEEIPRSMTHGMLLREGTLSAKGAIGDVMTPQGLSACFGVTVTVTESTGRLHARARQRPIHQSEGKNP